MSKIISIAKSRGLQKKFTKTLRRRENIQVILLIAILVIAGTNSYFVYMQTQKMNILEKDLAESTTQIERLQGNLDIMKNDLVEANKIIEKYKKEELERKEKLSSFGIRMSKSIEPMKIINESTFFLPVSPRKNVNVDLISTHNYALNGFKFEAAINGSALAKDHYGDEIAIFVASNITTFKGQEFGFRISLEDNVIYGFLQDSWGNYKHLKLMDNDGKKHMFEVITTHAEGNDHFKWIIDGIELREYEDLNSKVSFSKFNYYIIATTHRVSDGWDSEGLGLRIGGIQIIKNRE